MATITAAKQVLINAVRAHAEANYDAGWDVIVEAWADARIAEAIGKARTEAGAIKAVKVFADIYGDRQADAAISAGEEPSPVTRKAGRTVPAESPAEVAKAVVSKTAKAKPAGPVAPSVALATWGTLKTHGGPGRYWYFGRTPRKPATKPILVDIAGGRSTSISSVSEGEMRAEGLGTASRFWAVPVLDFTPAPATPAREASATDEPSRKRGPRFDKVEYTVPVGYELRWPHASFDSLKRVDPDAAELTSAWLVVCTRHGETIGATSAVNCDELGSTKNRPEWCSGCKSDAKA